MRLSMLAVAAALLTPVAAHASETVTYAYDAKGRLTSVSHAGSVNGGTVTSYSFDRADNRTRAITTGAWLDSGARAVVVTPLRAGPVIPLLGR